VAGIEPYASKINVDAWARRQNYGRGTRGRSLGNFGRRVGDRLLSRMRSAITTAAQSIAGIAADFTRREHAKARHERARWLIGFIYCRICARGLSTS
jgi:hypothetical protein